MDEHDIPFTVTAPDTSLYILTTRESAVVARALHVTAQLAGTLEGESSAAALLELRDRFAVPGQEFA